MQIFPGRGWGTDALGRLFEVVCRSGRRGAAWARELGRPSGWPSVVGVEGCDGQEWVRAKQRTCGNPPLQIRLVTALRVFLAGWTWL